MNISDNQLTAEEGLARFMLRYGENPEIKFSGWIFPTKTRQ